MSFIGGYMYDRNAQRGLFDDAPVTSKDYLDFCRTLARTLVRRRGKSNTDEIRSMAPVPDGVNPSVLGWVFRDPMFKRIGTKRRELNKGGGGYIEIWTFSEDR